MKKLVILVSIATLLATSCATERHVSKVGAPASPAVEKPHVNGFKFFKDGTGWALTDDRLSRSSNGGRSWSDKTPGDPKGKDFSRDTASASFVDGDVAWIARKDTSSPKKATVSITSDGGSTWSANSAKLDFSGMEPGQAVGLFALDTKHAWLVASAQTSSASSAGVMYRTSDGGASWSKVSAPIAGDVEFTTATDGWLTGGAVGNELFETADGGTTWEQLTSLPVLSDADLSATTIADPLFTDAQTGVLPVQVRTSITTAGSKLYFDVTHDGGKTWTTAGDPIETTLDGDIFSPGLTRVSVVDANTWLVIADRLYRTDDAGKSWTAVNADRSDLSHASQSQFTSATDGWAYVEDTECVHVKTDCTTQSELIRTTDGGNTWTADTPS